MPFLVDVEATLDVPNVYAAPTLSFSYPGSSELGDLWDGLAAVGWGIPELPSIPYQASSWMGDGRQSREQEYRVEDFALTTPNWSIDEIADRGIETINLLRRYGVDVHMPISYLDFLRKTQLQLKNRSGLSAAAQSAGSVPEVPDSSVPAAAPLEPFTIPDHAIDERLLARRRLTVVPDLIESGEPLEVEGLDRGLDEGPSSVPPLKIGGSPKPELVTIPQVIMLSTKAWSVLQNDPVVDVYEPLADLNRNGWTWSETDAALDQLGKDLPDPRIFFETIEFGWRRTPDEVPTLAIQPDSQTTRWFIVYELSEANKLVQFLHEHPEVSARIIPMDPIEGTGTEDGCLLVGAVVPLSHVATVNSKLADNFPSVIPRGEPAE